MHPLLYKLHINANGTRKIARSGLSRTHPQTWCANKTYRTINENTIPTHLFTYVYSMCMGERAIMHGMRLIEKGWRSVCVPVPGMTDHNGPLSRASWAIILCLGGGTQSVLLMGGCINIHNIVLQHERICMRIMRCMWNCCNSKLASLIRSAVVLDINYYCTC